MERYLVRYGENLPQVRPGPPKMGGGARHARIRDRMPGVAVRTGRGRLWLDGPVDREVLSRVFGVVSFSPTVPCLLEDLDRAVLEYSDGAFQGSGRGHLRGARKAGGQPPLLLAGEGRLPRFPDTARRTRGAGSTSRTPTSRSMSRSGTSGATYTTRSSPARAGCRRGHRARSSPSSRAGSTRPWPRT